jgi:hypothetical protein
MTSRTVHTNTEAGTIAYANWETHADNKPWIAYGVLRFDVPNDFVRDAPRTEFCAHALSQMDAYAILATGGFND